MLGDQVVRDPNPVRILKARVRVQRRATVSRERGKHDPMFECDLAIGNLQGLKELRLGSGGGTHFFFYRCRYVYAMSLASRFVCIMSTERRERLCAGSWCELYVYLSVNSAKLVKFSITTQCGE